jgi:8-oxo-dGTP diphosphatase
LREFREGLTAPLVAVGAIALGERGLLMVKRSSPPETGRWTLPGGKVRAGETLAEAVEREVLEETGMEVRCEKLRGWTERITEGFHYVILDFDVAVLEGSAATAGSDAADASWVALDRVGRIETTSGLVEFLQENGVLPPSG